MSWNTISVWGCWMLESWWFSCANGQGMFLFLKALAMLPLEVLPWSRKASRGHWPAQKVKVSNLFGPSTWSKHLLFPIWDCQKKKQNSFHVEVRHPPKKTRCAKMISTTSPDLGEAEDPEQEDLAARWSRILLNDFPSMVKSARAGMIRQTCKLPVLKKTLVGIWFAFALYFLKRKSQRCIL